MFGCEAQLGEIGRTSPPRPCARLTSPRNTVEQLIGMLTCVFRTHSIGRVQRKQGYQSSRIANNQ
eukprot:844274-Amphidinium_carterae.1